MKSITRYALTFALAAGAVLLPLKANAQTKVKGEFDLSVKTHLAQLTLVPGHYTLAIEQVSDGLQLLRLTGPEGTAVKPIGAFSNIDNTARNYFRVERVGNAYAVREFHCGSIGRDYAFRALTPTEIEGEKTLASAPQQIEVAVGSR